MTGFITARQLHDAEKPPEPSPAKKKMKAEAPPSSNAVPAPEIVASVWLPAEETAAFCRFGKRQKNLKILETPKKYEKKKKRKKATIVSARTVMARCSTILIKSRS